MWSVRTSGNGMLPLGAVSGVVVAVTAGFARGMWLDNLHNGLLGLAFTCVGAYVLHQQPRNRCGFAFLATGVAEAVMFLGRQIGHDLPAGTTSWWGWLGVWPLVVCLFGATVSVVLFPDGRVPAAAWRWVLGASAFLAVAVALMSALWAAGFDDAGLLTRAPFELGGWAGVGSIWSGIAHTTFAVFQLLWIVAVVDRWRRSRGTVRLQLAVVGVLAAASVLALGAGLLVAGSPTVGLLAACFVPVGAGWAIVHGQYLSTRSALTWMAGRSAGTGSIGNDLAAAVGESLGAGRVALSMHRGGVVEQIGAWQAAAGVAFDGEPTVRREIVDAAGGSVGELLVHREAPLTRHEHQLLDAYGAQASFVIEHLLLATALAGRSAPTGFDHLSPRERDVLALLARGLSNAAICEELHLSVKTVEPLIGSIFIKLRLPPGPESNRRVLAAVAYVEDERARS